MSSNSMNNNNQNKINGGEGLTFKVYLEVKKALNDNDQSDMGQPTAVVDDEMARRLVCPYCTAILGAEKNENNEIVVAADDAMEALKHDGMVDATKFIASAIKETVNRHKADKSIMSLMERWKLLGYGKYSPGTYSPDVGCQSGRHVLDGDNPHYSVYREIMDRWFNDNCAAWVNEGYLIDTRFVDDEDDEQVVDIFVNGFAVACHWVYDDMTAARFHVMRRYAMERNVQCILYTTPFGFTVVYMARAHSCVLDNVFYFVDGKGNAQMYIAETLAMLVARCRYYFDAFRTRFIASHELLAELHHEMTVAAERESSVDSDGSVIDLRVEPGDEVFDDVPIVDLQLEPIVGDSDSLLDNIEGNVYYGMDFESVTDSRSIVVSEVDEMLDLYDAVQRMLSVEAGNGHLNIRACRNVMVVVNLVSTYAKDLNLLPTDIRQRWFVTFASMSDLLARDVSGCKRPFAVWKWSMIQPVVRKLMRDTVSVTRATSIETRLAVLAFSCTANIPFDMRDIFDDLYAQLLALLTVYTESYSSIAKVPAVLWNNLVRLISRVETYIDNFKSMPMSRRFDRFFDLQLRVIGITVALATYTDVKLLDGLCIDGTVIREHLKSLSRWLIDSEFLTRMIELLRNVIDGNLTMYDDNYEFDKGYCLLNMVKKHSWLPVLLAVDFSPLLTTNMAADLYAVSDPDWYYPLGHQVVVFKQGHFQRYGTGHGFSTVSTPMNLIARVAQQIP